MFVVADTTPLNYLILLREIELIPALYDRVVIPLVVLKELSHPKAPPEVSRWASHLPDWCSVRAPISTPDQQLSLLDPGERDAIQLAIDVGLDTLLIDEVKGRREATLRGLRVVGTISILESAAHLGLIEFNTSLERLEKLGFRLSRRLRAEFLMRNS